MPLPIAGRRWPVLGAGLLAVAAACAPAERAVAPAPAAPRAALAAAAVTNASLVVTEAIMNPNSTDDPYEWFEVHNAADTAVNLKGFAFASANDAGFTVAGDALVQPRGYALFVRSASGPALPASPTGPRYVYGAGVGGDPFILNNSNTDWLTVKTPEGALVDSVAYAVRTNGTPGSFSNQSGRSRAKRNVLRDCSVMADNASWAWSQTVAANAVNNDAGTPGFANDVPAGTPTSTCSAAPTVTVGVTTTAASLAVGGTVTLTATALQGGTPVTPTSIAWSVAPVGRVTFSGQSGSTVVATGATAGSATVTATVTVDGQQYTGTTALTVNAPATTLTVEGYSFRGSDPLPVGFQELYRAKDPASGAFVRNGITWTTSDANVATVDALGNVTAVAPGSVNVIATETATGRTGQLPLTVSTFAWSDTVGVYANPLQFGTPTDADPSDDVVIRRQTYAASWSDLRGQPNWVTYNLDGSHRTGSAADRCDCFTPDPLLPAGSKVVTSADYDGTGFSRGHMTMSADRTRGALDNATTFYLSNIIPQTNQNNGGPWLGFETYLGNLAASANKEIFIVAGGAKYQGWLQSANAALAGQQRVAVPTWTWKVAVILDRDRGLAGVRSASDVRVMAIAVPNNTTIPQVQADWPKYQASVDSIEKLTGYDVLAALPDDVEALVEAQTPDQRAVAMDVQPARISLAGTAVASVVLLSGTDFDATSVSAAAVELVVNGGAAVAPISRGGVYNTTVRDVNGDGKLDRVIGFAVPALKAAGLAAGTANLVLRPVGASPAWRAVDVTPSAVVP